MQSVVDLIRALHRRLAAEHGGFMIEVIVSAALIVSAGGGVLMAMDAAGRQSTEQRLQAIAADVAQGEMERLRSQKFDYLTGLIASPYTQDVASAGNTFTVESRAEWAMQAPPGAVQCTNSARNPEALKISTTVTWKRMGRRPVRLNSLVAAPIGSGAQRGTYVVQITNRDGVGLSGIAVSMNGATPVSGSTDSNGCVRFTELTPGPYTIQFSKAGYIDYDGDSSINEPVDVVGGQTRSKPFEIDRAGTAVVSLRYDSNTNAGSQNLVAPGTIGADQGKVTISHSLLTPSAQVTTFTGTSFTTGSLYPFAGGYQIYSDSCVKGAPTPPASMVIDPAILNKPITLQLPAVTLDPDRGDPGDKVWVRTACGNIIGPRLLGSGGARTDGWPYGLAADGFSVCVEDQRDTGYKSWDVVTFSNTSYDTPTLIDRNDGFNVDDRRSGTRCDGWGVTG